MFSAFDNAQIDMSNPVMLRRYFLAGPAAYAGGMALIAHAALAGTGLLLLHVPGRSFRHLQGQLRCAQL